VRLGALSARLRTLDDRALLLLGRHWPVLVLLALAGALRLLVTLAYSPVLWFYGDSFAYLGNALRLRPYDVRPIGYSFFLQVLAPFERLDLIPLAQHLMGLAIGLGVYALVVRLSGNRWLATAAAAPVLLDAYQLQLEHLLMADTLSLALVAVAFGLVLHVPRPSVAVCAWAGLALSMATLTRTVSLVLVVPLVAYLVARRAGVRRVLATVALFSLPLHVYSQWFASEHLEPGLSAFDGFFLYGRVIPFAACEGPPPPTPLPERVLCNPPDPADRPGLEFYLFDEDSPAYRLPGPRAEQSPVLRAFALETIREQPGDYLAAVLTDVRDAVGLRRKPLPSEFTYSNYRFFLVPRDLPESVQREVRAYQGLREGRTPPLEDVTPEEDGEVLPLGGQTEVDRRYALPLVDYQRYAHVPGTAYAAAALLALLALVLGRPAGPEDRRRAGRRHDAAELAGPRRDADPHAGLRLPLPPARAAAAQHHRGAGRAAAARAPAPGQGYPSRPPSMRARWSRSAVSTSGAREAEHVGVQERLAQAHQGVGERARLDQRDQAGLGLVAPQHRLERRHRAALHLAARVGQHPEGERGLLVEQPPQAGCLRHQRVEGAHDPDGAQHPCLPRALPASGGRREGALGQLPQRRADERLAAAHVAEQGHPRDPQRGRQLLHVDAPAVLDPGRREAHGPRRHGLGCCCPDVRDRRLPHRLLLCSTRAGSGARRPPYDGPPCGRDAPGRRRPPLPPRPVAVTGFTRSTDRRVRSPTDGRAAPCPRRAKDGHPDEDQGRPLVGR
jgi:hypothetical protein